MRMPVLFLGHGSPMNAIEDNEFHRGWRALGERLPRPRAVLCVSAHWETRGVYAGAAARPETIHDFYGFPKALFDVRYRASGDPALARRAAGLAGARLDEGRGLDHGAWGVLIAMYPDASVPVVQLSLDTAQPGAWHYALAKKLAPLRDEGILVAGSGNIVHNLGVWRPGDGRPYDWALRFDAEVRRRIDAGDHAALADYAALGNDARMSAPTPEHYLPLLYALALWQPGEPVSYFNERVTTSISMTSVVIGAA
jgi:4,5-DOPA dioxygenase extradiol